MNNSNEPGGVKSSLFFTLAFRFCTVCTRWVIIAKEESFPFIWVGSNHHHPQFDIYHFYLRKKQNSNIHVVYCKRASAVMCCDCQPFFFLVMWFISWLTLKTYITLVSNGTKLLGIVNILSGSGTVGNKICINIQCT